ncbi:RAI1 like PD-XK nuclease-domain-containing protein [Zychaea mexicana]|uniref:RAI1 like PD-XK nuclease-domain-containing protein n=1 Tax=Zychaea mexicana TaxID=64656 RepID=UPI0022FE9768|nr:RAI1 like PD-XK nuclease-domain-containing protein [Zychaea mexicana]KAI9499528.1 RAI1 like PD-XK nuclease-domain-containing protein [Zychaea mexicana]
MRGYTALKCATKKLRKGSNLFFLSLSLINLVATKIIMSKRKHLYEDVINSAAKRFHRNGEAEQNSFRVLPAHRYSGRCPEYRQPIEVNSYSIDADRRVWFDDRELKYYAAPRLTSTTPSLSYNYDRFVQRDETIPEHIDTLLDALTDAKSKSTVDDTQADIVTWRGIMTKLFCTPFSRNEPWELRVTRSKGTIYIEEQQTEQKRQREATTDDRQRLMSYWGYQFEAMCTSTDPKGEAPIVNEDMEPPNTNVQYCVIVRTRLGGNSIIMGAEVDCIEGLKPSKEERNPLKQYIELKTSRRIDVERQQISFEKYKLLKFWAQSFLVGVPRVVCGFRDDNGVISHLETLKTLEIPRKVRGKPNMWDPSVCMNFTDQFLNWLKSVVTVDDPSVTYSVAWKEPWREIFIECNGKKDAFLTQRYLDGTMSNDIGGPRAS